MKKIFLLLFVFVWMADTQAQIKKLQEYIESGHTFDKICRKVDKMIRKNKLEDISYREGEYRKNNGAKEFLDDDKLKFERWKWYWRDRLTEDGKFPDLQRQWILYNKVLSEAKIKNRQAVHWKHEGPVKNGGGYWGMGRTTHIDFHPSLTNIFYVASPNGGLWKTTDSGKTYASIADNLPYQPVGVVIVDREAPNTLYITLGEKEGWWQYSMGVYKSTDGGSNWNPTGLNWKLTDNKVIYSLIINPKNSSILMAATSDGLYKTWNGGNSWDKIRSENFSDVSYKPGDTSIVYAATNDYWGQSNVLKSTDGGNVFVKITDFAMQKVFLKFATTLDDANYLGLNMSVDGARKFYLSKNNGSNFEYISDMPENLVMYFSQQNKQIMYCGYVVVYKSTDGGKNWNQLTDWWNSGRYPEIHADQHFIAHHPIHKDELYFCCDGGVYRYHENTDQWDELVNGLAITQFYKLAISNTNPPVIIGGSQDNGGWIKRSNNTWGNTNGGDAMSQVIDPGNPNIGYTEYWGGNAVYRTTNGFNNLDDITPNIGAELPGQWVTPFSLNPKNPKTFIIGYNDVFISHDRCITFRKISNNLTGNKDNDLREVKISPVDTNLIIATRANIMYISPDYGKSWKTSNLITTLEITGLEFHPKDTNRIWCTRGGFGAFKVMTSKDRGNSWINITRNFVNTPVSCIIFDEPTNTLFVGTDFGVFYSDADNIDWQYYGSGLPHTAVTDLKIHTALRKLYISTYGRGFYSIDLPSCNFAEVKILSRYSVSTFEERDSLKICAGTFMSLKAKDSLTGTYRWKGPGLDTTIVNDPQLSIKKSNSYPLQSGNYILEFTSDSGCVRLDTFNLRVLNRPNFSIVKNHPNFNCHVDSLVLRPSVVRDTVNYAYRWFNANQWEVGNYSSLVTQTGMYWLELKNLSGNCSFYDSIEITRIENPSISFKNIQSNDCHGDSIGSISVAIISGVKPYKYIWSNGSTDATIQNLKSGIYHLHMQDANLCQVMDTFIISEPENFQLNWNITPSSGNNGGIQVFVSGSNPPYSYIWTLNGSSVIISEAKELTDLSPGLYDLKITDSKNCIHIEKGIEVKSLVDVSNGLQNTFSIYPNPVRDYMTLRLKENWNQKYNLEIVDLLGKKQTLNEVRLIDQHTLIIKLPRLIPGEYFLNIRRENEEIKLKFSKI